MTEREILRNALAKALRGVSVAKLGLAIGGVQHAKLVQIEGIISAALATPSELAVGASAQPDILEDAIAFIESLAVVPLLMGDEVEMRLEDVQDHARIEAASLRKHLADRATRPAPEPAAGVDESTIRKLAIDAMAQHTSRKASLGLKPWCRENGVHPGHASEFLAGKRAPTSDLLQALGFKRVYALLSHAPDEERIRREAAEDTARLDWLEANCNIQVSYEGWNDAWEVHRVNGGRSDREWTRIAEGPDLRSAIDAARAEQDKAGGRGE